MLKVLLIIHNYVMSRMSYYLGSIHYNTITMIENLPLVLTRALFYCDTELLYTYYMYIYCTLHTTRGGGEHCYQHTAYTVQYFRR